MASCSHTTTRPRGSVNISWRRCRSSEALSYRPTRRLRGAGRPSSSSGGGGHQRRGGHTGGQRCARVPTRLADVVYVRDKDGDGISCGRTSLVDFWCLCKSGTVRGSTAAPAGDACLLQAEAHCGCFAMWPRGVAAALQTLFSWRFQAAPVNAVFDLFDS